MTPIRNGGVIARILSRSAVFRAEPSGNAVPIPRERGGLEMHRRRIRALLGATTLTVLSLFALSLGSSTSSGAGTLDLALCAPDQNTFTVNIDNAFYPLPVGQQWVLVGDDEGQTVGLQITVFDATERFYSGQQRVTTRVVEEREWEDLNGNGIIDAGEPLREVSLNYFAQTQDGTVCYFGEDVDIYEGGVIVSHEGAWRADAEGNAPGIFMPASPRPGMKFQQEVAPGVAEDEATIHRSGTVVVPAGTFTDTIEVRDFNPLDGSRGTKIYARNVGLIMDDTLSLVRY
jgi:hypothetical protein